MLSKVCSAAVNGIDAYPVEVEANEGYGDTVILASSPREPQPRAQRCANRLDRPLLQAIITEP